MAVSLNRVTSLVVVPDIEPIRTFFVEKLGFKETTHRQGEGGGVFAIFEYFGGPVAFATPGGLPGVPSATTGAMFIFEVSDVAAAHTSMSALAGSDIGPLVVAPFGRFYDVEVPGGTRLRFLTVEEDAGADANDTFAADEPNEPNDAEPVVES